MAQAETYGQHVGDVLADIAELNAKVKRLQNEVKWARNELCLKCGSYKESHLGACDGCRFKHGGEWERDLDDDS